MVHSHKISDKVNYRLPSSQYGDPLDLHFFLLRPYKLLVKKSRKVLLNAHDGLFNGSDDLQGAITLGVMFSRVETRTGFK